VSTAKLLLVCLVCLTVAVPAVWGQATNHLGTTGIPGVLDPQTGAFRPMPLGAQQEIDASAAAVFGGTINLTITITLKTTAITTVTCSMTTSTTDGLTSFTFFTEGDTVAATGTGTTRSCKLTIPYAWSLASQSTDMMNTSYTVLGNTGTAGLPQRIATRSPLDVRKVPANGAITSLTAAVTL